MKNQENASHINSAEKQSDIRNLPLKGLFAAALVRDENSNPDAPTFNHSISLVNTFAQQNNDHVQLQFISPEAGVAYIQADYKGIAQLKEQTFVEKKSKGGYANIETLQAIPVVDESRTNVALGRTFPHQPA